MTDTIVTEHLIGKVTIGDAAKAFLDSDLGRNLQDRGQKELEAFQVKLQKIGTSQEESDRLRAEIKARISIFEWMVEAINEADNAESILSQGEQED